MIFSQKLHRTQIFVSIRIKQVLFELITSYFSFQNMKGHTHLTASERDLIVHLRKGGMSYRHISEAANVTYNQVLKLLNKKSFSVKKERRGVEGALTGKEKRRIKRLATNDLLSSAEIKRTLDTKVSARTIRRHLHSDKSVKYGRLYGRPNLTKLHKKARLEWAKKDIDLGQKWKNVIFSDKKFNLLVRMAINDFGML